MGLLSEQAIEEVKAIAERAGEEAARRLLTNAPLTLADRFVSVPKAAEVSGYEQQTIRKWICQKRLKNYGRYGSPRVRLSEILNLEGV